MPRITQAQAIEEELYQKETIGERDGSTAIAGVGISPLSDGAALAVSGRF